MMNNKVERNVDEVESANKLDDEYSNNCENKKSTWTKITDFFIILKGKEKEAT